MSRDNNDPLSACCTVTLGGLTLIVLLGAGGAWAALANILGAIIASGCIEVAQNRQIVHHPDGDVVASIAVKEGAQVSAGDILMTLDPSRHLSELAILESLLFELIARRERLEAKRENHTTIAFDPLLQTAAAGDIRLHCLMQGQIRLLKAHNASLGQKIAHLRQRRNQIADQIIGITAQK